MIAGNPKGMAAGPELKFFGIEGGVVGQGIHLQVGPEGLNRVQLWCVGRQEGRVNGAVAAAQFRPSGSMNVEPVPYDDDC